ADKATLTKILTYHVVGQKLTPEQLDNGSFETLQKGMVATKGSGESYKVNGAASVVCGNVKTANANVYIIDTVLMPK
ncbi:fasciclin domain-containing protein, partial [Streptomyces sp. NPDC058525]|uniref:fasciclin domain-containing protein n=1 Tax=Streptomyces sp. NPDC058525 TaxID=3346538 RepID=UPI00364BA7F1